MSHPTSLAISEGVIYCLAIFLHVTITSFWVIHLIRNARKTWREYKLHKNSIHIDYQLRIKVLFNYRTVLIKDAFLVCIAIIECIQPLYIGVPSTFIRLYTKLHNQTLHSIEKQDKCKLTQLLDQLLVDPAIQLIPISYGILTISSMMLLIILSTYLARRYFGYSLEKRLLFQLVTWWASQILFLFISLIPYLQLLIFIIPILMTIDWILLVKSSRKLSRTIKSKLFEVLHFENDRVRYRMQRVNYITYNVFITIHLFTILSTILLITLFTITASVKGLILNQCYLKQNYNIDLQINLDIETRAVLRKTMFTVIDGYAMFSIELVYGLLLVLPYLCVSLAYLSHVMCRGTTCGRAYRFNNAMIEPLLAQNFH